MNKINALGGEFTAFPGLRRVGCAFACIDAEGSLCIAAHFPLPGSVQTVPRGGLPTLLELVNQVKVRSIMHVIIDKEWVCKTFNNGPNVQLGATTLTYG